MEMKRKGILFVVALLLTLSVWGQERLSPAPEGTFTYAVFSDTHRYAGGVGDKPLTNAPFVSQVTWLADNIESQRIVFISHAGDLADRNNPAHYKLADGLFGLLHGRVPYAVVPGNHDVDDKGDTARFQQFFGAERFEAFPWYGGSYKNNANSWQTFSSGGLDFVIVHLECNASDDALAWADKVLEQNRERMAIIVTHMYLGPVEGRNTLGDGEEAFGRMRWSKISGGNSPEQMWEKSFSKHENVFLIVSGDQATIMALRQESKGVNGNVVHEVMANYPVPLDKEDWLRLYRFDPEAKAIQAFTYSPAQERLGTRIWHLQWREAHLFELDISDAIGRFHARNKK
jgi:hypothetical protein